ncbi:MAG: toprim domain-containing protein [Rhodospirillales bacterium]
MTPAERIARALTAKPTRTARGWLVRCVAHDDRDPSLSLADGDDGRLLVRCFAGCDARDVLAALRHRGLLDDRPTDGYQRPRQAPPPKPAPVPDLAYMSRLWDATRPVTADDPAGRYLVARGCRLPHPDGDLRWSPALRHRCGHVGPALVGLVTAATDAGQRMTLHRTWIMGDGSGRKAPVDPPRLVLRDYPKLGGVVRLWPDCEVTYELGLGEGVETALTLARGFTPVWSTIDAGNLKALPVLAGTEAVTVAVDHDPAGIAAFEALAERWTEAGREVRRIMSPTPGEDLNDWAARVDHARR